MLSVFAFEPEFVLAVNFQSQTQQWQEIQLKSTSQKVGKIVENLSTTRKSGNWICHP
jgi:hypothetical protein